MVEQQNVRQEWVYNYSGVGIEQLWVCVKRKAKLMGKCNLKFFV